jgi:replicative DNA helicase
MQMLDVEAIKSAARIEDVIGGYVELKQEGSRRVGLCPFHAEKAPSFYVTPEMGIFKCFGCDAGGDVLEFVKKIEAISFRDAARRVAEIAGIAIEENGTPVPARQSSANTKALVAAARQPRPAAVAKAPETVVKQKLIATYPYTDVNGELVYEVLRFEPGKNGKGKDFRQRRCHEDGSWIWGISAGRYKRGSDGNHYPAADGNEALPGVERLLWRLPAVTGSYEVVIVEGEKDVLTLEGLGFVATTASGGSKAPWLDSFSDALRGKRVVIIPDADSSGEAHGRKIEKVLTNIAAELVYVRLPKGFKDITEYVEAGRSQSDIDVLVRRAEEEQLEAERKHRGLLSTIEVIERQGGLEVFVDPNKRERGLLTGYHKLDEMTMGLQRKELFILAARPSQGKTAFALNISHNIARRRNTAVAFFSQETPSEILLQRMTCAAASVDSMKFRAGYCTAEEVTSFHRATQELTELPLFLDDYTPLEVDEIRRKTILLGETAEVGLVVVDYLSLLAPSRRSRSSGNKVVEVSELSRGLKLLAGELKIPFLVLCQLSRACEVRPGDHRPILSDLRESGAIEQDADTVGFMFRQETYRPDKLELKGKAELILAKQRNGPTGKVRLEFKRNLTRFDNPPSHWNPIEEDAA